MKFLKLYFIKLRYVKNLGDTFWFQLIDAQGSRPANRGGKVFSKRYKSVTVGARNFTKLREGLERGNF